MKKVLFAFVLILCFSLYAEPSVDKLLVKTTVEPGFGVDKGDNPIPVGDGVYIYLQLYTGGSVPTEWESDSGYSLGAENEPITANLVSEVDGGLDSFYILVGINGNPEKETGAQISFSVDGWYKGDNGATDGAPPVEGLDIWCTVTSALKNSDTSKISVSEVVGDSGKQEESSFKLTHAAGLQKTIMLAGYSLIDWSYDETSLLDAGNYSSTVTIEIQTA